MKEELVPVTSPQSELSAEERLARLEATMTKLCQAVVEVVDADRIARGRDEHRYSVALADLHRRLQMIERGSQGVTRRRRVSWEGYPVRRCQALHHCRICDRDISIGQPYYDGGYSRRAHVACVLKFGTDES